MLPFQVSYSSGLTAWARALHWSHKDQGKGQVESSGRPRFGCLELEGNLIAGPMRDVSGGPVWDRTH